jgi:hypothetical protein
MSRNFDFLLLCIAWIGLVLILLTDGIFAQEHPIKFMLYCGVCAVVTWRYYHLWLRLR